MTVVFDRWFKRDRAVTPLGSSATRERTSLSLDPALLPPPETPAIHITTRAASGGQRLGGGGGSSLRPGDLVEIALPAVLIATALYFGNRAPQFAAPAMPSVAPSFSSSPSGPAPSSPARSTPSFNSGTAAPAHEAAPSRRSPAAAVPGSVAPRRPGKQTVLSVDLDEKGQVLGLEVLETSGVAADAKAIAEVRKWAFTPTIFKGRPVRSRMTVRYP